MELYTIYTGDQCGGDENYSVLKGPNGFECWLTEPEDRAWNRDGKAAVQKLNDYEQALAEKDKAYQQLMEQTKEMATEFLDKMNKYGEWEEGCFYYNKYAATELQWLIGAAQAFLKEME